MTNAPVYKLDDSKINFAEKHFSKVCQFTINSDFIAEKGAP